MLNNPGQFMVIVEYCRYGNLRNYLINHRNCFVKQLSNICDLDDNKFDTISLSEATNNYLSTNKLVIFVKFT